MSVPIVVHLDGDIHSIDDPLPEGEHALSLTRQKDDMISMPVEHTITLDTQAPSVQIGDYEEVTARDRIVVLMDFSEPIAGMSVNGQPTALGSCNDLAFSDCWYLILGENTFETTITDYAGNTASTSMHIVRTAE